MRIHAPKPQSPEEETAETGTAFGGLAATKTGQTIAKKVLIRDIEILPDEGVK